METIKKIKEYWVLLAFIVVMISSWAIMRSDVDILKRDTREIRATQVEQGRAIARIEGMLIKEQSLSVIGSPSNQ